MVVVATTETFYAHVLNTLTNCYIFYAHNVATFLELHSISVTDSARFRGSPLINRPHLPLSACMHIFQPSANFVPTGIQAI